MTSNEVVGAAGQPTAPESAPAAGGSSGQSVAPSESAGGSGGTTTTDEPVQPDTEPEPAAGGSGGSVEQQPSTSCVGDRAHIFCVDFEDLEPGQPPEGFEAPGGVNVVETASVSGMRSLRFDSDDGGDARLVRRDVPGEHWGRVYLRVDSATNGPHEYMHSAFVESNVTRMVDAVNRADGMHNWKYNVGHAVEPDTDYEYVWNDEWICAEWHSIPSVGPNGRWEFYLEEQPIEDLTGEFDIAKIPETYEWMKFGVVVFHQGARVTGWMDDIVVSSERVGCDLSVDNPTGSRGE